MTTTITPRVGSSPTADNTKRVAIDGPLVTVYGDVWGGTWTGWGNTWSSITDAVPSNLTENITRRVSGV